MSKIKVIISTGTGPLHFIGGAISLLNSVDLKLIQGWVPTKNNTIITKILSKLIGRNLEYTFNKRGHISLREITFSCAFSDFFRWGLTIFSRKFGFPKLNSIIGWSYLLYGYESKQYITNSEIFHVRAGAGQGGAILKAKVGKMKVVVDFSIAHPSFMDKYLANEYNRNNFEYTLGMDSPLFQKAINDSELADCLLVNSNFVKDTFIEEGYPKEKITVITQGVRNDFFGLKNSYKLKSKIKLLFTGTFGFRKGAEYLLKGLQLLEKEGLNFELVVLGKYTEAQKLLEKYPLKSINLVGFVPQDELKLHFINSDMYIFPSLCEGCASSALEAMAAGLPVIATKESGLPIESNVDGIIIPTQDEFAIINAIKELINNNDKRMTIGTNAANKIKNHYSWEHYANNLILLYNDLLNKK